MEKESGIPLGEKKAAPNMVILKEENGM